MAPKAMSTDPDVSEPVDATPAVDLAFRRAALIQVSKVSVRLRRRGARRRQGTP